MLQLLFAERERADAARRRRRAHGVRDARRRGARRAPAHSASLAVELADARALCDAVAPAGEPSTQRALEAALRLTGLTTGGVWARAADGSLREVATAGGAEAAAALVAALLDEAGSAPALRGDLASDTRLAPLARAVDAGSAVIIPLALRDLDVGVLALLSPASAPPGRRRRGRAARGRRDRRGARRRRAAAHRRADRARRQGERDHGALGRRAARGARGARGRGARGRRSRRRAGGRRGAHRDGLDLRRAAPAARRDARSRPRCTSRATPCASPSGACSAARSTSRRRSSRARSRARSSCSTPTTPMRARSRRSCSPARRPRSSRSARPAAIRGVVVMVSLDPTRPVTVAAAQAVRRLGSR